MPAFTIVLSLLGAFAAMYAFDFSLDNLSLMALMIAIGFVVDDAIVEVENVFRHIEDGAVAAAGGAQGSAEIRFTVLSISVSLIAVFIPLLLMGGIVGRLFFEFAVTVMAAVAVSAFVSLSLAPMLCARFLGTTHNSTGRLYRRSRAGSTPCWPVYRRTLDTVLRHQPITLAVFFATMALTIVLSIEIPKGFFPIQDTGMISGLAEAAQEVSPAEMMRLQRELGASFCATPRSRDSCRRPAARAAMATPRQRIPRASSSRSSRAKSARSPLRRSSTGCGRRSPRSKVRTCFSRPRRTSRSAAVRRGRASSTHCRMPTSPNWSSGRRRCSTKLRTLPELAMSRPTFWRTRRVSR